MADADDIRDARGRFKPGQTGNPDGAPPRIAKVRAMLDPHREDLVQKAVALALDGNTTALTLCLERLAPVPRATHEPVQLPELLAATTPAERADAVVRAAARGELPPDVAEAFLGALRHALDIAKAADFERRLAEIEMRGLV